LTDNLYCARLPDYHSASVTPVTLGGNQVATEDQRLRGDALPSVLATLDAMPVPAVLLDPDLTVEFLNRSMLRILAGTGYVAAGRTYEELVSHCWSPASAQRLSDMVRTAVAEAHQPHSAYVELQGEWPRAYRFDVTSLDLEGGQRFIVSHLDVTGERQWREETERLRLERERTQRIGRMGTWRLDFATGENTWSPEMYVITGHDPRTFVPTDQNRHSMKVHPDSPEVKATHAAIQRRHPFRARYQIVRPGGSRRWIENVGEPERDEAGEVTGFVGVVRDITDELERERAIERDRNRLERAQSISRTGDIEVDLITGEVWTSAEFRRLFDLDEGTPFTRAALEDRVHPADWPILAVFWDDPRAAAEFGEVGYRVITREGRVRHLRGRALIRSSVSTGHEHVTAYAQDVTPLVEASEQIRERESRLREAERVAQVGHWEWSIHTGDLVWSDEVYRIFGYEVGAFAPSYERFLEHVHRDDRDGVQAAVNEGLESGTYYVQHRIVRQNGTERVVVERGQLTRDHAGEPLRMLGIIQDVTGRVEAAEQIRDGERRLQLAVDNIGRLGLWVWDFRTDLLTWAPETHAIYGTDLHTEPPTGTDYAQWIHPSDRPIVEQAMKRALRGEQDYDVTYRITRPDGVERMVHSLARLVAGADGKASRIMGTVRDVTEQHELEGILHGLSTQLVEAQEIARIGSWEWDLETGEMEWSPQAWLLYGEDPSSGKKPADVLRERVPPEEQGLLGDVLREIVAGSERVSIEHRVIRADGQTRTVRVHARATAWADGRIRRVVGSTQDITEEAAREAAVQRATALLAHANAMARLAPYEWDPSGSWWWSEQLYEILGYEPEQLPANAESLRRVIHTDDLTQVMTVFREAVRSRTGWDMQYRMVRNDGDVCIVRDLSEWVETASDGSGVFRGSIQDITETARLREQAQESAAEVINIIDASLLPIIVIDEQGIMQRANAATERVFDWSREELIGRNVSMLASGVTPDEHHQYVAHYVATREASTPEGLVVGRTREVRARRRDGTEFPAQLTVTEAELGTNRRQFVGIILDLTEQKATEEHLRLMQKSEALGTLVAGVAHDFNNLLTAIRGGVDMAQEFPNEPRWLEIAMQASDRAAEVVRQLLRFSRRDEPKRVTMVPAELVREATLLSRETLDRRIWFTSHADENLPTIQGDPGQMQQVLMNLIVNARDAVLERTEQEPGRFAAAIQLTARTLEVDGRPGVIFEVRDNGTGMTEEVRQRALDPFFTTKAADRGTGLGLSAVVGIVEHHQGQLMILTRPDEGTEVGVWLPIEDAGSVAHDAPETPERNDRDDLTDAQNRTVLIVDDERSLGTITSAYLEAAGYRVVYYWSGAEALRQVDAQSISLAILDLNMPAPNGWEVMAALHRQDPQLPVVIASGFANQDEARQRGAMELLPKPYTREELVEVTRRLARRVASSES